jgi:hypothetical protein
VTISIHWVLKSSVLVSHRIRFGKPNVPAFCKPYKYDTSDNAYNVDCSTVEENIYRSRTAIIQPLTGKKEEKERKKCKSVISKSGLRLQRMRNICKEKPVSELNVSF